MVTENIIRTGVSPLAYPMFTFIWRKQETPTSCARTSNFSRRQVYEASMYRVATDSPDPSPTGKINSHSKQSSCTSWATLR
ncbi:hypothetical protein EB796_005968 [Bugula neritina]|uniref:Uncharacterized protein n=1 Tax=Bugula neritina TaxID=10212 RepID=A0A7J7KAQ1_BUGNE|nr:hypothetical protein EB796_005968 [Bugula neritina]